MELETQLKRLVDYCRYLEKGEVGKGVEALKEITNDGEYLKASYYQIEEAIKRHDVPFEVIMDSFFKINCGADMIARERQEQITKHGRTTTRDFVENTEYQLSVAAGVLCYPDPLVARKEKPKNWDEAIWIKMCHKPYKERLVIAGALLAAEIDRIIQLEKVTAHG